jgi:hypothetical protein
MSKFAGETLRVKVVFRSERGQKHRVELEDLQEVPAQLRQGKGEGVICIP